MNKIDISSTVIEKGIDLVRDFVEKFLGSSIEEAGLLISDNIKLRRFKNQIKILNKAQKIVEENKIDVKQISLKVLVPLLEYSSVEEDENQQDKWANLLINYIDIKKKYETTVFPYILSQLSSTEAEDLETIKNHVVPYLGEGGFIGGQANLIRLGLIRELPRKIEAREKDNYYPMGTRKIVVTYNKRIWYELTELGVEFLECCSFKINK
jgi:hypothetical protein